MEYIHNFYTLYIAGTKVWIEDKAYKDATASITAYAQPATPFHGPFGWPIKNKRDAHPAHKCTPRSPLTKCLAPQPPIPLRPDGWT